MTTLLGHCQLVGIVVAVRVGRKYKAGIRTQHWVCGQGLIAQGCRPEVSFELLRVLMRTSSSRMLPSESCTQQDLVLPHMVKTVAAKTYNEKKFAHNLEYSVCLLHLHLLELRSS